MKKSVVNRLAADFALNLFFVLRFLMEGGQKALGDDTAVYGRATTYHGVIIYGTF